MQQDLFEDGTITIDLGGGSDTTMSCDTSNTFVYNGVSDTITLPSSTYSLNYNYGATVGGISTKSVPVGYTFNNTLTPSTVNISTAGIDMASGTDITVGGQSLKEFMKKMEQRLAILVPDPAKLEKFEALKKAYEHYKTMESLCFEEPIEEESK